MGVFFPCPLGEASRSLFTPPGAGNEVKEKVSELRLYGDEETGAGNGSHKLGKAEMPPKDMAVAQH